MEFKLNKIDSDIRERFDKELMTDKIHEGKGSHLLNKLKDDDENRNKNFRKNKHKIKSKKIVIEGFKVENKTLEVEAEKYEPVNEENIKGTILDVKK